MLEATEGWHWHFGVRLVGDFRPCARENKTGLSHERKLSPVVGPLGHLLRTRQTDAQLLHPPKVVLAVGMSLSNVEEWMAEEYSMVVKGTMRVAPINLIRQRLTREARGKTERSHLWDSQSAPVSGLVVLNVAALKTDRVPFDFA